MKFLFVAAFCAVLAYVAAETCSSTRDCDFVNCDSGHALECLRGECTCSDSSQGGCSNSNDCSGACRHDNWRCIGGICRCGLIGR